MAKRPKKFTPNPEKAKAGDSNYGKVFKAAKNAANPANSGKKPPLDTSKLTDAAQDIIAKANQRQARNVRRLKATKDTSISAPKTSPAKFTGYSDHEKRHIGSYEFNHENGGTHRHIGELMDRIHFHANEAEAGGPHQEHHQKMAAKYAEMLHSTLYGEEEKRAINDRKHYDGFVKAWNDYGEQQADHHAIEVDYARTKMQRAKEKHQEEGSYHGSLKPNQLTGLSRLANYGRMGTPHHIFMSPEEDRHEQTRIYKKTARDAERAPDKFQDEFYTADVQQRGLYHAAKLKFRKAHVAVIKNHPSLEGLVTSYENTDKEYSNFHKSPEAKAALATRSKENVEKTRGSDAHEDALALHARVGALVAPNTDKKEPKKKPGLLHRTMRAFGLREANLPEGVINAQEIILEFNDKVRSNRRNRRRTTASSRRGKHGPDLVKSSLSQLVQTRKKQMADRKKRAEETQKERELKQELQQIR